MLNKEIINSIFALSLTYLCLSACESPSVPVRSEQSEANPGENGYDSSARMPPTLPSVQEVICTNSRNVLKSAGNDDFSGLLDRLCSGPKATTELFEVLKRNAYDGTGEPKLETLDYNVGPNYVTTLGMAYALRLPLKTPGSFGDKRPHDAFIGKVVAKGNSSMMIHVLNRQPLPGGAGRVEKILLEYDLQNANGSGIVDKRKTELNVYLPSDDNRDVSLTAEHLLDADNNQFYHSMQSIMVGFKAEEGYSYFLFLNEIIVKNRIDPERIKTTFTDLTSKVSTILFDYGSK